MFLNIFAVSNTVLLHIWFYSTQAQHNSVANSFTRCYGQHLRIHLPTNFTAGCAKVNCPKGKRRSLLEDTRVAQLVGSLLQTAPPRI